jgi:osmotically inducible protein OsmC
VHINCRTLTVTSIRSIDGSVRSIDGAIGLQLAVPVSMGDPSGETNPEELFAASYAACFHGAVKCVAADNNVAIERPTVEAHADLCPNDEGPGFTIGVELHVTLPGVDAETAKDVVRAAYMISPYSNATRNNIDLSLSITPADGNDYDIRGDWHYVRNCT